MPVMCATPGSCSTPGSVRWWTSRRNSRRQRRRANWSYCRFPILDGADNPPELLYLAVNSVASLLSWGLPTLVFCGAGMSRSPAVSAAALAIWLNEPADHCLAEVAGHGSADVSPGLWQSLAHLFPSG